MNDMATRSSDAQTEVETKFYNLDAEQAVLGSALIDPEAAAQLPLGLRPCVRLRRRDDPRQVQPGPARRRAVHGAAIRA